MRHTFTRRVAAAVLGYAVILAGLAIAPPPAQAVPGLTWTSAVSATDGQTPKIVTADCPRGTVALDGGGYVTGTGGGSHVIRLTGLYPHVGGFTATAVAPDYPGQWRLHSFAICAPRLPGMAYHATTTALSDRLGRSTSTNCPGSQKVVGGGAAVVTAGGVPAPGVALHSAYPTSDLERMLGQAYRVDDDFTRPWQLEVVAVCADPLPGMVLVTSNPGPGWPVAGAVCPGKTRVHGVGGHNSAAPGHLAFVGMYPTEDLGQTVTLSAEVHDPDVRWNALAFAICAD